MSSLQQPEVYITNTYLANLQAACARRGRPYPYLPNTTLNEIFKILPDQAPQGTLPLANYWVIGREGTVTQDYNGRSAAVATYHNIEHTGLFEFIPFARRKKDNDLTPTQQKKYCLREEEPVDDNGDVWINYWGFRIPQPTEEISLKKLKITNGVVEEDVYYPQSANMRPSKPLLKPDEANVVYSEFITTSDKIVCALNREEIEEVISACQSLYGHATLAAITELGIVQGVDRDITVTDHRGVPFNFKEVVGAQIVTHCCKANGSLLGEQSFQMTFDSAVTDVMAIG